MRNITANDTEYRSFLQTTTAHIISAVFAFAAVLIVLHQIYLHLKYYTCSNEQRWIVRILFFVPIYAIQSWLSLICFTHDNYYVYLDSIREIYEGIVIYSFLSLCYEYLGGEGAIMNEVQGRPIPFSWVFCTCCFAGKPFTIAFLRFCKQATLQFCVVRPLCAVLCMVGQSLGLYHYGSFAFTDAYLYVTFIVNASITLSLYGLFLFYFATKEMLLPFDPVSKFFIVKSVIFLSFWQGLAFELMERVGWLKSLPCCSRGVMAAGTQSFFICLEMLISAILLRFAFPHSVYSQLIQRANTTNTSSLFAQYEEVGGDGKGGESTIMTTHSEKSKQTNQSSYSKVWRKTRLGRWFEEISGSLKESMNPADMWEDAVHNFHPQYKEYTQHTHSQLPADDIVYYDEINGTDEDRFVVNSEKKPIVGNER